MHKSKIIQICQITDDQIEIPWGVDFQATPVIGLGEMAHGSGDLHELAGKVILSFLAASEKNISILIEAPGSALSQASKKVAEGENVLLSDLDDGYAIWRTAAMLKVLNQFSKINKVQPGKIEVMGFDARQPLAEILTLLTEFPNLPCLRKFSNLAYIKLFEIQALSSSVGKNRIEGIESVLLEILSLKSSIDNLSPEIKKAYKKVNLWANIYRHAGDEIGIFKARDAAMFEITSDLISSQNQTFIWAHLGHLLYNAQEVESSLIYLNQIKVTGQFLRESFLERFKTIAISAKNILIEDGLNNLKLLPAPDSLEEFLEPAHLYKVNHEAFCKELPILIGGSKTNPINRGSYLNLSCRTRQFDYFLLG